MGNLIQVKNSSALHPVFVTKMAELVVENLYLLKLFTDLSRGYAGPTPSVAAMAAQDRAPEHK